jgi:hypothetical protein
VGTDIAPYAHTKRAVQKLFGSEIWLAGSRPTVAGSMIPNHESPTGAQRP